MASKDLLYNLYTQPQFDPEHNYFSIHRKSAFYPPGSNQDLFCPITNQATIFPWSSTRRASQVYHGKLTDEVFQLLFKQYQLTLVNGNLAPTVLFFNALVVHTFCVLPPPRLPLATDFKESDEQSLKSYQLMARAIRFRQRFTEFTRMVKATHPSIVSVIYLDHRWRLTMGERWPCAGRDYDPTDIEDPTLKPPPKFWRYHYKAHLSSANQSKSNNLSQTGSVHQSQQSTVSYTSTVSNPIQNANPGSSATVNNTHNTQSQQSSVAQTQSAQQHFNQSQVTSQGNTLQNNSQQQQQGQHQQSAHQSQIQEESKQPHSGDTSTLITDTSYLSDKFPLTCPEFDDLSNDQIPTFWLNWMQEHDTLPQFCDWKTLGAHYNSWNYLLTEANRIELDQSKQLNEQWYKWLADIRSRKLTSQLLDSKRAWWKNAITIRDDAAFMVSWAKDRLKSLNSKQISPSNPNIINQDYSNTPDETPDPCSQRHPKSNRKNHTQSHRHSRKHRRNNHTPPRRPSRKRRRKNTRRSRIHFAQQEAQSQVSVFCFLDSPLLPRIFA